LNKQLIEKIEALKSGTRKILLWGVSFALLDLAELVILAVLLLWKQVE